MLEKNKIKFGGKMLEKIRENKFSGKINYAGKICGGKNKSWGKLGKNKS